MRERKGKIKNRRATGAEDVKKGINHSLKG